MTVVERAAPVDRLTAALLAGTAAVATVLALGLPDSTAARWIVAAVVMLGLGTLAALRPEPAVLATMAWLIFLGLTRRLVSSVQADPDTDPLLLVAPIVSFVLLVSAWRGDALRRRSLLMTGVIAFLAVATVAVVNPSLPLRRNVTGWLFWGAPLLWFFIGRGVLQRERARLLLWIVAGLGGAATVAGLVQVFVGFPSWDHLWLRNHGYRALEISGPDNIRAFGWSSSSAEYALLACIVAVVAIVLAVQAFRRSGPSLVAAAWGLLALGALGGLVLSGVRTAVLLGGLGLLVVAIAARGWPFHRFVIGALLIFGGIVLFVQVFHVETWYDHGAVGMVRRSFVGLAHPFDGDQSTLGHHVELTRDALAHLNDHPLGFGPAAGTQVGKVYELGAPVPAENDLGNAAIAFGLPGLALVVLILVAGLRLAWRRGIQDRDVIALAILGIAVVSLRFWWNGGHYATATILWLLLGYLDGVDVDRADPTDPDPP